MRFVAYILALLAVVAMANGCAAKADYLTPRTLIALAGAEGELRGEMKEACAADPVPRFCAMLGELSLLRQAVTEQSLAEKKIDGAKLEQWLAVFLRLARKAATGL